jgi:hypothetical protein
MVVYFSNFLSQALFSTGAESSITAAWNARLLLWQLAAVLVLPAPLALDLALGCS